VEPFERFRQLNTKGNLWPYILSILKEKPTHAWQLQPLVEEKFGFKPGRITPYRVLYRLEETGFVKSQKKERRRVYQITEKGGEELRKVRDFYKKICAQHNE